MIGVTQLINSNLTASLADGLTEATAFTSHQEVADSGLSDGRYYLNDGTRTRQYYFSVDGTAAGQSTGGWARIDSTSMGSNYSGQECTSGSGIINSSGQMRVQAQRSGYGSSNHGGCGVGYNSTYFKARKFCFTGIVGSSPSSGAWYNTTYLNIYTSPTTLRSDWYGNQSGNGGYYYPGAYAFPTNGEVATVYINNYSYAGTTPPTNTTSLATSVQYDYNGNVGYPFTTGVIYDMFTTADRIFHFGQSVYAATNAEYGCTLWFKF